MIGSAIFNITLVIAVCALAAEHTFTLSWYSVLRDCSCYLISTAILLAAIADEKIYWLVSGLVTNSIHFVYVGFSRKVVGFVYNHRVQIYVISFSWDLCAGTGMRDLLGGTKENNTYTVV